jgi:hypothetical protein
MDTQMDTRKRLNGYQIVESVRLLDDASVLRGLILAHKRKKARLPPREPGTARENDACS